MSSNLTAQQVAADAARQAGKRIYQSADRVQNMDAPQDGGVQGVSHETHDDVRQDQGVEHVAPRAWSRPNALMEIREHPVYAFRWVSIDWRTVGDGEGLIRAIDEQWQPVQKGELKGYVLPSIALPDHGSVVGKGRLVLCKMHKETKRQRDAYYAGNQDRMTRGVMEGLKGINDKRMPITAKSKTQVTFRQRRANIEAKLAQDGQGLNDD